MKLFKSIKWRLQVWYGLFLLIVLVGFGFTAYQLEYGRQLRRIDGELMRRANALAGSLRRGPGGRGFGRDRIDREGGLPGEAPSPEDRFAERPDNPFPRQEDRPERNFRLNEERANLFDESDTNSFYFAIWTRDNRELARSTNAPADLAMPEHHEGPGPQPPYMRGQFREAVLVMPPGEIVLVGRFIGRDLAELRAVGWELASIGGLILLAGLAGGWWIASRAIRPVEEISSTASKIAAGDLSQRINVAEAESELGQLASVLNATFARLDAAFEQQQQFTSDAAHELRTPISVMLTQTQMTLKNERKAEEYRATVEACQRSAQRMRRLVESLLELARLDAGQETMRCASFDLTRLVTDSIEEIRPLATTRGIVIEEKLESAECIGDSERLGQVITNLLTNAVNYNRENGSIRVVTRREGGLAIAEISDSGIGIPPEHLPNVFKRFYRVDTARTTSQGRSGLGLAISKAIVEAHGGSIEVASQVGEGTKFTVRLPAS